jgi:hypothetical protein
MARSAVRVVLAALGCIVIMSGVAVADEVAIKSTDYAQLPPDAQDKLVAEMKKQGLLAKNDHVRNAAEPSKREQLSPAVLLVLVPAACKVIADVKKRDELAKCASSKEPEAARECTTSVETTYGTIETVCNAIKLL